MSDDVVPFPFTIPEELNEAFFGTFCPAVGKIVVSWSLVEHNLDLCIAIVFQVAGGKHLAGQLPRGTKRKTTFLKRAFKALVKLAPFKDEAVPYFSVAACLAQTRHTVVHGVVEAYDKEADAITMVMLDSAGDMHQVSNRKISIKRLAEDGAKCEELCLELLSLNYRLRKALLGKELL